jgi:hypothetical protein
MRRICCWCHKIYGEKCQRCGSASCEKITTCKASASSQFKVGDSLWSCRNCGALWLENSQPDTHGVCGICEPLMRAGVLKPA